MPLTKAVRRRLNRQTQYCGRRLEPAAIGVAKLERRRLEHPTVVAVSAVKHLEITGDAVAAAKPGTVGSISGCTLESTKGYV